MLEKMGDAAPVGGLVADAYIGPHAYRDGRNDRVLGHDQTQAVVEREQMGGRNVGEVPRWGCTERARGEYRAGRQFQLLVAMGETSLPPACHQR